jgi:HK97 family phage major capsid protein
MSYAQMAQDNRNKAITDMRAILDRAVEEGRDLTPEEIEQTERADADAERWGKEVDRAVRADKLAAEAAEFRGITSRVEGPETTDKPAVIDLIKRGFQAVRDGGGFSFDAEQLRHIQPDKTFYRALQSAGATAIPTTFIESVIVFQRTVTPMLDPGIVTILETPSGNPIDLPRLTADPNHGGTVTAEAAGIVELDPTLSKVTLGAFKYGVTNLWSAELDQDNVINLEDLLGRSTGRELGLDVGTHLTTGTGTVQPKGIVDAATSIGTANGTALGASNWTFVGPHDLLDLYYAVAAPYRNAPGAAWMANADGINKMRKFRDSNQQFLWDGSLVAGAPDTFNGRPVYENPAMAAPASATKSFIFGDLSAYYVRRTPIRVEFSRDYKFNTDQLALRTIMRVDGNLPDAIAVKTIISANT